MPPTSQPLQTNFRLWIYSPGTTGVFGDGKYQLLRAVEKHGSLQAATREIGISYRKAWADLHKAEQCLGIPLLTRTRGGTKGGQTTLTPHALVVLAAYDDFHRTATARVQQAFSRFQKRLTQDQPATAPFPATAVQVLPR
jgi:molybdate transport system regulatory protein